MSNNHQVTGPNYTTTRKKRRGMIEKRRRDKINNSLCELRRLVPAAFEKQGSAKLEKAEILQMTVDYLRMLHARGLADSLTNNKNPQINPVNQLGEEPATQQACIKRDSAANLLTASQADSLLMQQQHHHQQQQQQQQTHVQAALTLDQGSAINNPLQVANLQQHQALDTQNHHHTSLMMTSASTPTVCQPSIYNSSTNYHHLYNQHHHMSAAAAYYPHY